MQGPTIAFGEEWSGYIGHSDQSAPHTHVAIQVCIGLESNVTVQIGARLLQAPVIIIAPFVEHRAIAGAGRVAYLYVYPDAGLGRSLVRLLGEEDFIATQSGLLGELVSQPSLEAAVKVLVEQVVTQEPMDDRLARALGALRNDWSGQGAVSRAASVAGISGPRLRVLARSQMGVPLSQWIVWRKLERACRSLAEGADLTQAAMDGMFSDQAHFTRMMQRMMGISPARAVCVMRDASETFKTTFP